MICNRCGCSYMSRSMTAGLCPACDCGITVTLSGNSTPLLPSEQYDQIRARDETIDALRARLAEAEARAGRAEEAVRVLGDELSVRRRGDPMGVLPDVRKQTDANPAARAAVEGAK